MNSGLFQSVEHRAVLEEFGKVMATPALFDSQVVEQWRTQLIALVGEGGWLDACGVAANFHTFPRVVDVLGQKSVALTYTRVAVQWWKWGVAAGIASVAAAAGYRYYLTKTATG